MNPLTARALARLAGPAAFALALMAGSLLTSGIARASTLLIDNFSAPTAPVTSVFTGVDEATFNQFTATVPGGVRGVYHHSYTNPLNSVAALAVGNGQLSSSSGVGVQTEVLVFYGAFTRPTLQPEVGGPLLGLDATPYGAFRFDFSGLSGVMNINVVLYTASPLDPVSPLYYSTTGVNVAPASPGASLSFDLPFALSDPFNFARVDGIALVINRANGATGLAWNLDSFSLVSAVPEPAPAVLLLAGLAVLGWLGQRQAARAAGLLSPAGQ